MGKVSLFDLPRTSIFGILAFAIAAGWQLVARFSPEFLRAFIYERLLSTIGPTLVDYGPSAVMVVVATYLFWVGGKSWRGWGEATARFVPIQEVVAHVTKWINDTDAAKYWPEARRVRQAALDGKI